jgi:uncharacterized protein YecE (DUF72 family)
VATHLPDIRIGTSGWSYEDWRGVVYPRHGEVDRLAYLAEFLDTFEVNSSFYHPPSASLTASWLRRTPERLDFTVKLHQRFTHERAVPYARAEVEEFRRGIDPLHQAGRLGALLLQFPWSFRFDEPARLWLDQLARDFRRYNLVVEVRHAGWQGLEAIDFLRSHHYNLAMIDQPELPGNLPPTAAVTGPVGYVRLHGRNRQQWFASMRTEQDTPEQRQAARDARYDYLYSQEELRQWVPRIADLAARTERTYVFANNHPRGQAAANALQLKAMLTGEKVRLPEPLAEAFGFLGEIAQAAPRQGRLF